MENINIPKKPGVYKLTNKINGKIYIGESINVYSRIFYSYKKTKNNNLIDFAIRKYGFENFEVEILAEFENINEIELLALETAFIEFYDSTNKDIGYNICLIGNNRMGFKHSIETKHLMSKNNARAKSGTKWTELTRLKMINNKPMLGKHHSTETKKKISMANTGKKLSEESKIKCGIASKLANHNAQKKKVKQINLETEEIIKIWDSVSDAHKETKINKCTIYNVCNKRIGKSGNPVKTAGGFKWSYL